MNNRLLHAAARLRLAAITAHKPAPTPRVLRQQARQEVVEDFNRRLYAARMHRAWMLSGFEFEGN